MGAFWPHAGQPIMTPVGCGPMGMLTGTVMTGVSSPRSRPPLPKIVEKPRAWVRGFSRFWCIRLG